MDHQRDCGSPLDRMDESILRMMLDEDFGGFAGSPVGASGGRRTTSRRPSAEGGTVGDGAAAAQDATFSLPDLHGLPLAMVYSPVQRFDDLYDPETGLGRGTIFRSLDFPFYPAACGTSCGIRR